MTDERWLANRNAELQEEIERLTARIKELERINYNLTRDNIEQVNKLDEALAKLQEKNDE